MDDLLNILTNSNKDIDNQKLMDYLSGKLSTEEKHEVEKWMVDNQFLNEAVEGLQDVNRKKDLEAYVTQLNRQLNQYLQQKKNRRESRKIGDIPWTYLAIILILFLIIIAYLVIRNLRP